MLSRSVTDLFTAGWSKLPRSIKGRELSLTSWREWSAREPLTERAREQTVREVPVWAEQLRRYPPGARFWLTALHLN